MTDWFDESLYPEWGQRFRVSSRLVAIESQFQKIEIFETPSHGCVLVLDGAVQVTERDEFVYQEMIAHVPLIAHGNPQRVLIVGAGDGGVLRRVLSHRSVVQAVMVEIDADVVRLAREFLPSIGGAAWFDERADVRIEDGIAFMANCPTGSFDIILIDSTDPIGVGEGLFTSGFYADCGRVLSTAGILVTQGGVPFMQPGELQLAHRRRREAFPYNSAYVVAVPTYVGGLMALGISCKAPAMPVLGLQEIHQRAARAGIAGTTSYWSPEIHLGAFALPPYIERLILSS